jgi:hypothetical protein
VSESPQGPSVGTVVSLVKIIGPVLLLFLGWGGYQIFVLNRETGVISTKFDAMQKEFYNRFDMMQRDLSVRFDTLQKENDRRDRKLESLDDNFRNGPPSRKPTR